MDALKERHFSQFRDRAFRITDLLQSFKPLNKVVISLSNSFCSMVRGIYRSSNNKSGVLLILSTHRLGDTVFTMPAILSIFGQYKEFKKYVVCFSDTKPILKIELTDEELIPVNKNDFKFGRRVASFSARKKIKNLNPEIIFDLTCQITSASLIYNTKANLVVGSNRIYLKGLYDRFIETDSINNYVQRYLSIVGLVIQLNTTDQMNFFFREVNSTSKILIHPFAIRKAKEWNLKRFIELAEQLMINYDVEIIYPPGFIESDIKVEIEKVGIKSIETNSVTHLIKKIKECSLFISNDSGPTYIAALLGKATFAIYGPTNPGFSLPPGIHHTYIMKKLKCSAVDRSSCFTYAGIYCPSNECMQSLSVENVLKALLNFMDKINFHNTFKLK